MSTHRKLVAILIADIVGFSRLIGIAEEDTLLNVRVVQQDVINPAIDAHGGRLVKRTGDGVLTEFRSVVEAVRCAMAIQNAMHERNSGAPSDERIDFRIGIHLGDVVEESDGDLMGDGVNVAARLEGLARPGGIGMSEDACRQVRSHLGVEIEDMGEHRLKNITDPIRVYSIGPPASPASYSTTAHSKSVIEKPSIAVLPFINMSGDTKQDYFVDGMVEDIVTSLSRFNELTVISRNSTLAYKGQTVDARQVGRDLGVRFVLEGSVRKFEDQVRITGQLVDALTGVHLWANRFDARLENIFELQDRLTASVVGELEPTMLKAEIQRALQTPTAHLGVYDLYLQALPHVYVVREDHNTQALDLLERAIDLDPKYAPALAHVGWCLVQRIMHRWPPQGEDDGTRALALARRALATGSDDAKAVVLGGFVLAMLKADFAAGLEAVQRAIRLNPGSGFVAAIAGSVLIFGDEIEQGLRQLEKAMSLSHNDPELFAQLSVAAVGWLFAGEPERAIEFAKRSNVLDPEWDSTRWVLIAAYFEVGRLEDARATAKSLLEANPDATASFYERVLPIRNSDWRAKVVQSLIQAGVPQ